MIYIINLVRFYCLHAILYTMTHWVLYIHVYLWLIIVLQLTYFARRLNLSIIIIILTSKHLFCAIQAALWFESWVYNAVYQQLIINQVPDWSFQL